MAVVRRVVFAGLILLIVWLVLFGLRTAIPDSMIDLMKAQMAGQANIDISHNSGNWDWSSSLFKGESVLAVIGPRLGITLRFLALTGLFGLVIAAVLLFLGTLISRVTIRPGWLARLRSILRLVIVSGGVSVPRFAVGAVFIVFMTLGWSWSISGDSPVLVFWSAFLASLLPVWLLVQAGHGEMANLPEDISRMSLVRHLAISLVIRLLRLVGVLIVIIISAEQIWVYPGLGRLFISSIFMRDFPVVFGIAWVFAVIVVLVKLVAGLVEIAYNHFGNPVTSPAEVDEDKSLRLAIPKGWLIFCLVLTGISILAAIATPLLAPYGFNEMSMTDRLVAPSAEHILGTDNLGRDILSRLLYGTRTDLFAGLTCAGVLVVLATGWATLSAYFRKKNNVPGDILEELVMLPGEIITAFPWLVLLLLVMSIVGPVALFLALVASLVLLPRAAEMIREAYLSLPEQENWLQELLRAVPVMLIFTVAGGILYITTASYLGFGVPPPTAELGGMLSGTGRQYMLEAPWILYWPSLWLAILLLTWVMAGDALLERLGFRSKAVWAKVME